MSSNQASPSFEWIRSESIASLNIEIQEYRHKKTGAQHFHIAADDSNNVFLVAFRTVPHDSKGVAHILEHTTLCGSQRYPVRDPFFMMSRRSLNTFMNAFTSSDWTAYPFASQNQKDFTNLLQVYLDAVFFPTLNELDFAQEGHRVEFAEEGNPDSELVYKGVVFNEMKGAMGSPSRSLWQALTSQLFPTVTYHYNSGGEPTEIPKLSYDELKAFHHDHYHPSNAIFMTYGNTHAAELQLQFEEHALKRFDKLDINIKVANEQRYSEPQHVTKYYALEDEEESDNKTFINLGWLLGESTDLEANLTANLLSDLLLDNSASPLRNALETTELANAPSPLCGLEDTNKEMVFVCGVEGAEAENAEAVEALILEVLNRVAKEGVAQEQLDSVLHQLELSQREVGGDSYPYGLTLILNGLSSAIHGGDMVAQLNVDKSLAALRKKAAQPGFIQQQIKNLLLNNPHRVRITYQPDSELNKRSAQQEAAQLAAIKAQLSQQQKQAIIDQAAQLKARQCQQDDPDVLPKVGLNDVPSDLLIPDGTQQTSNGIPTTLYAQGTNGLIYQQLVVDLPNMDESLKQLLPLYCDCLSEVGSAGRDYLETQAFQAAVSGGISANIAYRGDPDDVNRTNSFLVISSKALVHNQDKLTSLMQQTFEQPRFDELPRLKELITQVRFHCEQGVTDQGHGLAMVAASSRLAPSAALSHHWEGLCSIQQIKALDKSFSENAELQAFADKLQQIHEIMQRAPRQLLVVGEQEHHQQFLNNLGQWQHPASQQHTPFTIDYTPGLTTEAWTTSTQVNFTAKAYAGVAANHLDAPALMILAPYLRNGFLHRTIREQGGAYGGGASFDGSSGSFRFYSYRDPRLTETLADFDNSVQWLLNEQQPKHMLEEAILGIVSRLDQPASPAGEAKRAFHNNLHGRTPAQRRNFRSRVLQVTINDLQRVAEHYLINGQANTAVICNEETLDKASALNLKQIKL
ncbi:MAG: insulinase family protein [Gammaproteobacteria bacterium]|nr:insulinase family protein [Gammaproteobacteria bacterium]MCF6230247.1 insulinase family protein [Gammaproteobacteria bacterium]